MIFHEVSVFPEADENSLRHVASFFLLAGLDGPCRPLWHGDETRAHGLALRFFGPPGRVLRRWL
jgi:hypothetical protein